jgi:hypothetical protein
MHGLHYLLLGFAKGQLFRERKKLQRQALIERSQTLESLEKLRTYGGQPDAALMALLGDSVVQPSASSRKDEQNRSAPRLQQIGELQAELHFSHGLVFDAAACVFCAQLQYPPGQLCQISGQKLLIVIRSKTMILAAARIMMIQC